MTSQSTSQEPLTDVSMSKLFYLTFNWTLSVSLYFQNIGTIDETVNFVCRLSEVNYKNGDKFRGTFKDGRANGYGTIKYNYSLPGLGQELEEAEYKGNFKAGKRDGFGTITWGDGSYFKGVWKND